MDIIDRLEKKFGWLAVENLTYYLIGGQVLVFLLATTSPKFYQYFTLQGDRVMNGEWWLPFTFLFSPISTSLIFVVFVWYIFYLYGSTLERRWGSFRYLMYIFISYIASIALAFIFPHASLTNTYLYTSIFLAFAYIYPNFQLMLFFIIPVKIKWLAALAWIGIIGSIVLADVPTKVLVLISISNFLLFFWRDLVYEGKRLMRVPQSGFSQKVKLGKAYHVCAVCGDNERDNPDMQIRYCSKCMPSTCYCADHIKNHVHVRKPN